MNGVLIVPTGIGAEIGGHAGDANPVCKLIAGCCDKLITHPNVVNASDVNEMPENVLYVEGSLLDGFLQKRYQLKEIRQNKILVVANKYISPDTTNAVNSARVTVGINAEILELDTPLTMIPCIKNGRATGEFEGADELIAQVEKIRYDALAIHSVIEVEEQVQRDYFENGGVNPWGGVEALASKYIAQKILKPVAHAPIENSRYIPDLFDIPYTTTVDPRMAPEAISTCYLHCVLKGLNQAPRITRGAGLSVDDIDFMISPAGCWGKPHELCLEKKIPVIFVRENRTVLQELIRGRSGIDFIEVENYWEAAGVIMAMKAGIDRDSVRRPLKSVNIRRSE